MEFGKLSWPERLHILEPVLGRVLAELPYSAPTALVAERTAKLLGAEDPGRVANMLLKLAPRHPSASHTGSEVRSFGKVGRRWMWAPGVVDVSLQRVATSQSDDRTTGLVAASSVTAFLKAHLDRLDNDATGVEFGAVLEVYDAWLLSLGVNVSEIDIFT